MTNHQKIKITTLAMFTLFPVISDLDQKCLSAAEYSIAHARYLRNLSIYPLLHKNFPSYKTKQLFTPPNSQ